MARMRALLEADGAQTTEQYVTTEERESTANSAPHLKNGTRTSFAETVELTVGGDNEH